MKTLYHGAGYYLSDNRASGGIKEEADVLTCMHCQAILIGQKWREDGGFCGRCFAPVCGPCAEKMKTEGCLPFVKFVEQQLKAIHQREQFRSALTQGGVDHAIVRD